LVYRAMQKFDLQKAPAVTVIYGPQGVGKSFWLELLYQRLRRQRLRIRKLDALSFSRQYAYSAQVNNLTSFRQRMRTADLLLLDDLDLLKGKQQSIEELLYTYEYLVEKGSKLVLTLGADYPNLEFLGDRLSSRFRAGQSIPILPPATDELKHFIENYLGYQHLVMDDEAVFYMATKVVNLAQIDLVLKEFVQFAEVSDSALTLECCRQFWDLSTERERQKANLTNILNRTAEVLEIKPADILGNRRTKSLVQARQLAMYTSRQLCSESYSEIGRFYQRRHGTVLEACRKMDIKLADDKDLRDAYLKITNSFSSSLFERTK